MPRNFLPRKRAKCHENDPDGFGVFGVFSASSAPPSLIDRLGALSLSDGARFRFVLMIVIVPVIDPEAEEGARS